MNYKEANKLINASIALVAERFEEVFPDAFVKVKTLKPEEYENANPCMYSWYMAVVRGMCEFSFSPMYGQTEEEHLDNDWSCVDRFVADLQETDDFPKFLIEHVKIKP